MGHYTANSVNSQNFHLTLDNQPKGTLTYKNWYSFNAEIQLTDGSKYQLESKGIWDFKIELKNDLNVLLDFKMGWNGIRIRTFFDSNKRDYLLKKKGFFKTRFVLIDTDKKELLQAEADFKWKKFRYDYKIETASKLDNLNYKELLLLTVLHSINYYIKIINAAAS